MAEEEKPKQKQIEALLVVGEKSKVMSIPFIPKEKDIMQIGSKRYIVYSVKYKEVEGSFIPVITLAKEQ
jgi:hypothetical protein